jgi:SNF2 family DNA or RNA helicase
MFEVTGLVVSARPRPDGSFAVTLGPGPETYWYVAPDPPRLGSKVQVSAEDFTRRRVGEGPLSVTVLRSAKQTVIPAVGYTPRVVAKKWLDMVQGAMYRPLLRYQVEGAGWAASRIAAGKGCIVGDEPGLGKTCQAIAAVVATECLPTIVVCPKSLKLNWGKEFGWANRELSIEYVHGRKGPIAPADVVVLSYELLRYREADLARLGSRSIIFDEGHVLKEPRPPALHRAACATRLAAWIGAALVLTGTPVQNRPAEFWRLLHIVDPAEWPAYDDFRERYCVAPASDEEGSRPGHRIVTSYGRAEHLDELRARFEPMMLRRLKSEVLVDLPPKSRRSRLVELDPFDMQRYRAAESDVVAWLRTQGSGAGANRATRALALVKFRHLREIAAIGKLRTALPEYLTEWFDRTEVEPLVIFAYHRSVLYGTAEHGGVVDLCRAMGLRAVGIGGRDSDAYRQAAVDAFDRGEAEVFIAPIASAGVGLNLQRASNTLFLERVWVPAQMTQAEDRVHRIGQTKKVVATYLDAAGTIDEHLAHVADQKQELIVRVVDDRTVSEDEQFATAAALISRYAA